jgi:hypothetical protein
MRASSGGCCHDAPKLRSSASVTSGSNGYSGSDAICTLKYMYMYWSNGSISNSTYTSLVS